MPIRSFHARRPLKGDDVLFNGGHYILTVRQGQPAVFHDGDYIYFRWGQLAPDPNKKNGWVVTDQGLDRNTNLIEYYVLIGLNGETHEFYLKDVSADKATNRAVFTLAKKLGLAVPVVWFKLKQYPNSIIVKAVE